MTAGDGRMQGHVLSVRGVEKGEGRRANCKFRVASMTGPRLESNASPRAKSNASPRAKSRGGPRAKSRGVTLSTTSRDLHPAVKCGVLKLMGEGNQARYETPIDFKQIEKAIDDKRKRRVVAKRGLRSKKG